MIETPEKKKILLVDFDTPIYAAAAMIQKNPVQVTHKISKRTHDFKNKTEFRKWISEDPGRSEDDYDIECVPMLVEPVSHAIHTVNMQVERMFKHQNCKDVHLFVGGTGNYRKDAYSYYKSSRGDKPLAFRDCYEHCINAYKDIVKVCDGEEAEDAVSVLGWKGYNIARKTRNREDNPYIIAHIDKDLNMVPGWHWNYNKPEEPTIWVNDVAAAKAFWYQMLLGDKTDDIKGLHDIAQVTRDRHEIGKQKGCGPVGAEKILAEAKTEKEMATRVVMAYKEYYGDERFGGWRTMLNENALLLRMRSQPNEMFNCVEYCEKLGVI